MSYFKLVLIIIIFFSCKGKQEQEEYWAVQLQGIWELDSTVTFSKGITNKKNYTSVRFCQFYPPSSFVVFDKDSIYDQSFYFLDSSYNVRKILIQESRSYHTRSYLEAAVYDIILLKSEKLIARNEEGGAIDDYKQTTLYLTKTEYRDIKEILTQKH